MSSPFQLTTHELWVDGRNMTVSVTKLNPTTLRLTWNLPVNPSAFAGTLVLLSEEKFTSANFPVDGTRYAASTNFAVRADYIDHANVVFAAYGFFGDDITVTTVDVFNVDPDKVYYASIHAASNVLQYYTIGVQSYPLESSRFEKQSDSYAGSIPTSSVPPENPFNGQIYFDPASNTVLIWNDSAGSWLQSNQKTIQSATRPYIAKNSLFYNRVDKHAKFFDGTSWVNCTPANTQVKFTNIWIPFNTVDNYSSYPTAPVSGDFAYVVIKSMIGGPSLHEFKFFAGGIWFIPTPGLVQVLVGGIWQPISVGESFYADEDPPIPSIGDFYYDLSDKNLNVWDGAAWVKADTENEGSPTSDKIGIGTDGSYDERLRLIKILKHQLGYPKVCVELSEEQFNIAIDNALDEFRRRVDNAYTHRHVSFTLRRGQVVYYLNDPRDKTNKIVNVLKIHRVNFLGATSLSADNGLYAQAFYNQLYQGSNIDLLSIHLMNQLSESFEKIFAGSLSFTWDEASRELLILRNLTNAEERVVLEVVMERTEQELLLDRWAKQWLQGWAEAELLEMLGMIRTKYGTLPGPNGGITLNGDTLLNMASEKQTELLRQITDYEVGNGGVNFGNTAFLIG